MKTKEILGTDAISDSRVTINQNFKICEQAINDIARLVQPGDASSTIGSNSTSLVGGVLTLGNIVLTKEKLEQLLNLLENRGGEDAGV